MAPIDFLSMPEVSDDERAAEAPKKKKVMIDTNIEQLKRELVSDEALLQTMKEQRLHKAIIMDSFKMPITVRVGKVAYKAADHYGDTVSKNPQSHGLGCAFPHIYKPFAAEIVAVIEAKEKEIGLSPDATKGMKAHNDQLKTAEDVHSVVTHVFAKITFDEQSYVVEVAYQPDADSQAIRSIVKKTMKYLGATVHVGPPPPSQAERDLKAQIAETREKLGKPARKPRNRKRNQ